MDTNSLEFKIDQLKTSLDILILIEFCKLRSKRDDVREVFGTLDNNLFAKVNKIINTKRKQQTKT
jgi:hypothetical protein